MKLFLFAMLVAYVSCDNYVDTSYGGDKKEKDKDIELTYTYQGKFQGKCAADGLYFKDDRSFIYCSNGNAYQQPCSPGTRNSAYGKYRHGHVYNYRDFCDVNLVDYGYSIFHPRNRGYAGKDGYQYDRADSYAAPSYDNRDGYYGNDGYGNYRVEPPVKHTPYKDEDRYYEKYEKY